jgi:hypothetical protein
VSAAVCDRAEGKEPRDTIHVPAWLDARERLIWIEPEEARGLLASAMDQVERGWNAVRELQRWVEHNPEAERADDDYGALLTFSEAEVQGVSQVLASDLAATVEAWPGHDLAPDRDVDARLSEFARLAGVLVLATAGAVDVPEGFRDLVRQVARLRQGGAWATDLAQTFARIQGISETEIHADTARQAVDFLLHDIPQDERGRIAGLLVRDVVVLYARAEQEPPVWLDLLGGPAAPVSGRFNRAASAGEQQ